MCLCVAAVVGVWICRSLQRRWEREQGHYFARSTPSRTAVCDIFSLSLFLDTSVCFLAYGKRPCPSHGGRLVFRVFIGSWGKFELCENMHYRMSLWWWLLLLSLLSLVVVVRAEKDGAPLKLVKTTLNKPPFEGGSALKLHWADGTLDARENVFDGGSKKDNGGMEARIVGGTVATGGRYPYYARVVMFDANERIIAMCGGTVIHEDYVLSAAHCYENEITNFIDSILIIANYTQIMSRLGRTGFEQERYVQDVYSHPGYFVAANGAPNNDFLLLRLQQPTNGIRPVRLNDNDNVPSDEASLAVFGFGTLVTGGNTPLRLQEVDLNVVPFSDCNDRNSYVGFIKDDTMLCAGQTGQVSNYTRERELSKTGFFAHTTPIAIYQKKRELVKEIRVDQEFLLVLVLWMICRWASYRLEGRNAEHATVPRCLRVCRLGLMRFATLFVPIRSYRMDSSVRNKTWDRHHHHLRPPPSPTAKWENPRLRSLSPPMGLPVKRRGLCDGPMVPPFK